MSAALKKPTVLEAATAKVQTRVSRSRECWTAHRRSKGLRDEPANSTEYIKRRNQMMTSMQKSKTKKEDRTPRVQAKGSRLKVWVFPGRPGKNRGGFGPPGRSPGARRPRVLSVDCQGNKLDRNSSTSRQFFSQTRFAAAI